ncbi:MAG: zf-HC2 domain-containing protein [Polyangia bacterium]
MSAEEHRCLSPLSVERYLLGELGGEDLERVERAIAECERCASAVEAARADDRAFVLRPVPEKIRELWSEERPRRRWPKVLAAAVSSAAAALALALALPALLDAGRQDVDAEPLPAVGERGDPSETRLKGGSTAQGSEPSLGFYLLERGEPVLGRPGQALGEGDRIQFWYDVPTDTRGVIVGVDGEGTVTRYLPRPGGDAALAAGREQTIDSSLLLDDALGPERFFLCVGERIDPEQVEEAARGLVADDADLSRVDRLSLDCPQASTWILKK